MLFLAILLLLAAVGLLVAALLTGQTVLAWGSVGLSALVVLLLLVLIRRARRQRRKVAEAGPDAALDDEDDVNDPDVSQLDAAQDETGQSETARDEADPDEAEQASPQSCEPPSAQTAAEPAGHPVETEAAVVSDPTGDTDPGDTDTDDTEPGEEDTDAADLLVVWELPDEVLVVDEHPRYHLARCTWPDAAAAERLPVQEARELGFTPCAQCRPDAALARRRRAALAKQDKTKPDETKPDDADPGSGREPGPETGRDASSGGQDSDSSAVLG